MTRFTWRRGRVRSIMRSQRWTMDRLKMARWDWKMMIWTAAMMVKQEAHIGFEIDGVPYGRGLSQVDVEIGKGAGLSDDEFDEL